jgi:hypothetical protein
MCQIEKGSVRLHSEEHLHLLCVYSSTCNVGFVLDLCGKRYGAVVEQTA